MVFDKPNSLIARRIIEVLGSYGTPPEYGLKYFTVGIDTYLNVIEREYLNSYIKNGGATFKLVTGIYGGGKTHFLYSIRDLAWKYDYATSYVSLSSNECPFAKLEQVYKGIVKNVTPPLREEDLINGYQKGLRSFVKNWIGYKSKKFRSINEGLDLENIKYLILEEVRSWENIENTSFKKAMQKYIEALLNNKENEVDDIEQWLEEGIYLSNVHKRLGIGNKLDRYTAFSFIKSFVKCIELMGYSGLIILFDEAEQIPSLSTKEKEQILSNLREIIDECNINFRNVMFFYAIPDKDKLLDGRTSVYQALNQRLSTVFKEFNPTGVEINLENLNLEPLDFLRKLGFNLKEIYEIAYGVNLSEEIVSETIENFSERVLEERHFDIGYKRRFVQKIIQGFNYIKDKNRKPNYDEI